MKFCLNIFADIDNERPGKKLINEMFLDTSVKKLIIIAISPDVKETYINVKKILDLLQIQHLTIIDFTYIVCPELKTSKHHSWYPGTRSNVSMLMV